MPDMKSAAILRGGLGDEEIREDLALRRQQRCMDGMARRGARQAARDEPVEEVEWDIYALGFADADANVGYKNPFNYGTENKKWDHSSQAAFRL
jgi:hypothetical protein